MRRLRGIGPGIEARLRELVETGEIAELDELERELAPELVGIGRYLGLGARRGGRDRPGARRPDARRVPRGRAAGRLQSVPGIGPKTEAQILDALAPEAARRSAGSCSTAPGSSSRRRGGARRHGGRRRAALARLCERLAVVCAADLTAASRSCRRSSP